MFNIFKINRSNKNKSDEYNNGNKGITKQIYDYIAQNGGSVHQEKVKKHFKKYRSKDISAIISSMLSNKKVHRLVRDSNGVLKIPKGSLKKSQMDLVLDYINSVTDEYISSRDMRHLNIYPNTVSTYLSTLSRNGILRRISTGVYQKTSPYNKVIKDPETIARYEKNINGLSENKNKKWIVKDIPDHSKLHECPPSGKVIPIEEDDVNNLFPNLYPDDSPVCLSFKVDKIRHRLVTRRINGITTYSIEKYNGNDSMGVEQWVAITYNNERVMRIALGRACEKIHELIHREDKQ